MSKEKKVQSNLKKLKVIQAGSSIGCTHKQKGSLIGLGLRKQRSFMIHEDTPSIRGMIKRVHHLVKVEEVLV